MGRERAGERERVGEDGCHDTTPLGKQPHVWPRNSPHYDHHHHQNEQTMATMQGLTDEFQTLQKGARFAWQGFGGRGMLADGRVEQT